MPRLTSTPLTQKIINATRPPKTGFTPLRDPGTPGLLLRIWASGARVWSLEYRSPITGQNVRHGLDLPAGTLMGARARAKELRAAIAAGRDPFLDAKVDLIARQAAHSAIVTVADALGRYEDFVVKPAARAVSRRERMASLRKAVEPFNDLPVASLKRGAIVSRLDEIQTTRGPIARNRAQSEIRHWLGWLRDRDIVASIELDRVKKAVEEQARERVLTDAELTVLMGESHRSHAVLGHHSRAHAYRHAAWRGGEPAAARSRFQRRDDSGAERGFQDPAVAPHFDGRSNRPDAARAGGEGRARGLYLRRRKRLPAAVLGLGQARRGFGQERCPKASPGPCMTFAAPSPPGSTRRGPTCSRSRICWGTPTGVAPGRGRHIQPSADARTPAAGVAPWAAKLAALEVAASASVTRLKPARTS